jgi:hypothetical protein
MIVPLPTIFATNEPVCLAAGVGADDVVVVVVVGVVGGVDSALAL